MQPLMLHQSCDLGPIKAVTAKIIATSTGCEAEFRLEGGIDAIVLPASGPSVRADELWRTTCFEIFWQPIGGTSYCEVNLAPSGRWAAYNFDSWREGMREAPIDAIAVGSSRSSANGNGELVLKASIAGDFTAPAQVALNTIVQHTDGALQYWALAFGPGEADFHSEACRQIIVDR